MQRIKEKFGTRAYNILKEKGFESLYDIRRLLPRKYIDFTYITRVGEESQGKPRAYLCQFVSCDEKTVNGKRIVKAKVRDAFNGKLLFISWFGMKNFIYYLETGFRPGDEVFICGKVDEHNGFYNMTNPMTFKLYNPKKDLHIEKVYRKYKGLSAEKLKEIIDFALEEKEEDIIPEDLKKKYKLTEENTAIEWLHKSNSKQELSKAFARIIFDKLYDFGLRLDNISSDQDKKSDIKMKHSDITKKVLTGLPFELTKDQLNTLAILLKKIRAGELIDAIVQGDVGCGKTILAFILMILMAENDYQSVLICPTGILAKQHYEELHQMMEPYGIRVKLLHSGLKARERRTALAQIKDGEVLMVVGTHSVLSEEVEFKNLGMVITDEEHKFGVLQREAIAERTKNGIHQIKMSATPIPRSIAETFFKDRIMICSIRSMPKGRSPVKTGICFEEEKIYRFLEQEIRKGNQAYVVSPLITDSDNMEAVAAETWRKRYEKRFGKGIIGFLHGKMKKEEMEEVIADFEAGKKKILISTTVVEVGVNVPNATVIVINDAHYFGLASLHQLRGRVGRGSKQGYCILNSDRTDNQRLQALCRTTDGFAIAEEDLKIRGSGDVTGTIQSGFNEYVELALRHQKTFKEIQDYLKKNHNKSKGGI